MQEPDESGTHSGDIFENDTKVQFDNNQVTNEILQSTKEKCTICMIGDLRPDGKPTPMVVYGRDGAKVHPHQYKRCNFVFLLSKCEYRNLI